MARRRQVVLQRPETPTIGNRTPSRDDAIATLDGQLDTPQEYIRDKLEAGLSGAQPKEGEPTVAELTERIKALKAGNAAKATPQRSAKRQVSAEEPVTARILRCEQAQTGEWQRLVTATGGTQGGEGLTPE